MDCTYECNSRDLPAEQLIVPAFLCLMPVLPLRLSALQLREEVVRVCLEANGLVCVLVLRDATSTLRQASPFDDKATRVVDEALLTFRVCQTRKPSLVFGGMSGGGGQAPAACPIA